MENQDKLYEQFQQASLKAEGKDFPGMDKVWARVEDKLDHKVLKNENKLWKKIAVAASFLLLFTLGYQVFKDDSEIITPENSVVNEEIETIKTDTPIIETDKLEGSQSIVNSAKAKQIIQDKIVTQETVAVVENEIQETADQIFEEPVAKNFETDNVAVSQNRKKEKSAGFFNTPIYDAISVKSNYVEKKKDSISGEQIIAKPNPLLVVDGKSVVNRNDDPLDKLLKKSNTRNEEVETFEYLKEPLYIINGVEYTEEELFGKNPTSPYYPLDKQEIISTTILQGESATNLYGEKGKKGVVVVVTKNGKPLKK
ncbi:hypothetical protein J2X31_002872 [Flavobacterium arsenatis]|uniref:TonB-dependent receptor plug domain-containing protein n=1 Tax=Flavobacterium arsenatis TaxID=1484332 RepID=A0ABU1TSM2_9FLAO|nr:hypothetical protein [Flavobacterium arsenatis]MDR6968846.1 hypothetical protein [Flavobacterium arsenatis]